MVPISAVAIVKPCAKELQRYRKLLGAEKIALSKNEYRILLCLMDRLFGTGDHGRVEAEQKAAERSDEGDIKHEAFNGCFHIRSD